MFKDLVIPVGVVGILVSMVVPLSPGVLDFLLIANLLGALLLLISTLSITEPLKLSALPTILLLATLFRLALNVSTTRLILGAGGAGQAVDAFGHLVIQGNIVVGAVIFLVITLIQFIVIAKGSERVAEVSARFTLDALPGKQMSIDADVRAGLIDFETARLKRQDLQIESRFYGALDGAMKFVKGDAIAGIVITVINIVGGLIIGVAGRGLSIGDAAAAYTVLTVGDGLLSQIPALLNALAAGMVVTRVTRGDGATLARELLLQLGQLRRVKIIIAVVGLVLALVPGMPSLPFVMVALALLLSALLRRDEDASPPIRAPRFTPRLPPVWEISIREEIFTRCPSDEWREALDDARRRTYAKHGVILAPPELTPLREGAAVFSTALRGITVDREGDDNTDISPQTLGERFERVAARHLIDCIDDVLTRRTLDTFDREAPELAAAVVPGIVSVTQLTEVLKGLVREGISIRNFDTILQAVAESGARAPNERMLLQDVRAALARVISMMFTGPDDTLSVVTLDPVVDVALSRIEREGGVVDLGVLESLCAQAAEHRKKSDVVVVCSRGARAMVRDCLRSRRVSAPVVAWEEIVPEVRYVSVGEIRAPEGEAGESLLDSLAA